MFIYYFPSKYKYQIIKIAPYKKYYENKNNIGLFNNEN